MSGKKPELSGKDYLTSKLDKITYAQENKAAANKNNNWGVEFQSTEQRKKFEKEKRNDYWAARAESERKNGTGPSFKSK